ncbi:P-loop containing nucleoside triphosphate hydrolase protein [Rhexocercosporidium sp. MPI-PUGE-AT-0058]|nr:P-loop containing nucleoside triphosphate hydrolase protein [Rhexocercosporidium sp. MPI-PUGE-AT-0058]
MAADSMVSPAGKRSLTHMLPFPGTLAAIISVFRNAVSPNTVQFEVLWGLLYLDFQLSSRSTAKITKMTSWMKRARNTFELFRRCLRSCENDMNEAEHALVEVLESLLQILGESVNHLREFPSDSDAAKKAWMPLETRVNDYLADMDTTVKHLIDLTSYPKPNVSARNEDLPLRGTPVVLSREFCAFPVDTLSRKRNDEFFGRVGELERINIYLDPRNNTALRTYTLFGRRGVGKTDIALEFAHTNSAKFDAIFWVNCETSGSLRTSFAAIATALRLPTADRAGCHEENQLAVQDWLKTTTQHWLLIFDNAESSEILKGYWPSGANGAILITSRKYCNFANDAQRHGDTIKPFNERQSWDLFMKLLGPVWQQKDKDGHIKGHEEKAAKLFLQNFGGLAIAIQQAAQLVNNESIGGPTIASTLEAFKEHHKSFRPRHIHPRSAMESALDSMWDMSFNQLTRNGKDLLSILSLLSPDGVLLDLFLPTNQKVLEGKLHFCRQNRHLEVVDTGAALSSVITEPPLLRDAIAELKKLKLINFETRVLRVHRVVQEAMNYHSNQEMQMYFDSAAAVLFEAFPKQLNNDILSKHWFTCEKSPQLIQLFINCAWYLCEICDYRTCLQVITSARLACESTDSLEYGTLCSIAGCAYYELNDLDGCRKNFETFRRIQETLLSEDALEASNSLHNMGVLECASDNLVEAAVYFSRAITIRIQGGDEATNLLANSYLRLSRVQYNSKDYDGALATLAKSESLYLKITDGGAAPFMAHIHYAYGNVHYAAGDYSLARKSYNRCLGISNTKTSVHPITAAGYYSLGCVEFELKHPEKSIEYLKKALSIARLRSPARDDGTIARILWKTSVILQRMKKGGLGTEADSMRVAAELALQDPRNHGDCGPVMPLDDKGEIDEVELEVMYDALVPEFFR